MVRGHNLDPLLHDRSYGDIVVGKGKIEQFDLVVQDFVYSGVAMSAVEEKETEQGRLGSYWAVI